VSQPCEEKSAIIRQLSNHANSTAVLADLFSALVIRHGYKTPADLLEMESVKAEFTARREEWFFIQDRLRLHRTEHGC
jgi:hypothetical protein